MAGPTRISELADQDIENEDQIPFARGSGSSGLTFKTRAKDLFAKLFKTSNSSTINLSFNPLTLTLSADATANATNLNTTNSPSINLNWNSASKTLSAGLNLNTQGLNGISTSYTSNNSLLTVDAAGLLSLINELSSNMQNIGNYPYANFEMYNNTGSTILIGTGATGSIIPFSTQRSNNISGATLNTSNGVLTLASGTYSLRIHSGPLGTNLNCAVHFLGRVSSSGQLLFNSPEFFATPGVVLTDIMTFQTQFVLSTSSNVEIRAKTNYGNCYWPESTNSTMPRCVAEIWKVG